ncbi:2-iminobutanoate/2-iminopropanoate deaminase [Gelidibacter sediminis]|uniref:2-iminobutanoate/2-iminopropanoate deaminase n=1 Tax=Gelidibacter sediminis TaxID=1608710 RepID=A0A4R7PIJ5_9FLAO|nr:Rid family detoxifying hydrolase [Gelidibacter sediminis]TDU34185.1 2-iminobutanoate/2-iminopropanoate deaminase [Gelidibacter sediminis]
MKLKSLLSIGFVMLFLFSCNRVVNEVVFHTSHESKKKDVPFSDVVEYDGLLYLSGQIGMDHSTRTLVKGGVAEETKQCIANIKAVLEHHNTSLDKVIKCTVILNDINDFTVFNEVYKTYFPNKPARTTFAASGLALNANIEIDVIAAK